MTQSEVQKYCLNCVYRNRLDARCNKKQSKNMERLKTFLRRNGICEYKIINENNIASPGQEALFGLVSKQEIESVCSSRSLWGVGCSNCKYENLPICYKEWGKLEAESLTKILRGVCITYLDGAKEFIYKTDNRGLLVGNTWIKVDNKYFFEGYDYQSIKHFYNKNRTEVSE